MYLNLMYLNLKVAIWQTGLRQNRLAQTLNMDEALLSRIINGFREPTAEQRSRIAQVLQKDEQWLFAREPGVAPAATVAIGVTRESEANPEPNPV
jgi:transcriptional regulator with XRE-family HTH domain